MTRRMIDSSMWQNEKFQELPMCARLLQLSLINAADDQGRAKATPKFLKVQVFPYDDIPIGDIQTWLEAIQANGTIILYEADGKQYAQLTNWWKYQSLQYAQPSQFPRPSSWEDRIRRTATKGFIVTCNWYTVDGTRLDDTCDQEGNPLQKVVKLPDSPVTPVTNQPSVNGYSPESTPAHSPESAPEDIVLTKDQYKYKEEQKLAADEPPPPRSSHSTKKGRPEKKPVNPNTSSILVAFRIAKEAAEPGCTIYLEAEGDAAKKLAEKGWTPEQVVECFNLLKADAWWKDKALHLATIANQIGAKLKGKTNAEHTIDRWTPQPDAALLAMSQDEFESSLKRDFGISLSS